MLILSLCKNKYYDLMRKVISMKQDKKSFIIKKRYIILLVVVFFLIGGTSVKIFNDSTNIVVATNVVDTLNMMGENNLINQVLLEKIKQIGEERIIAEIEEKRVAEENRLEEEKKLEEEKLKLEEEARKIAEAKAKNMKVAYLTFDDGPSKKITPAILDILKDYNIKATFFVIGKNAENNPEIIKRIFDEGHAIGNHSYSHKYKHIYKSIDNFLSELILTDKVLKNTLGQEFQTRLVRLPGGSSDKYKAKFVKAAEEEGYKNYDWNALNGDTEGSNLSKERLINRLKSTIKKQKELIVLMHDTDTKKTTMESLPQIIDHLIKEGYEFRVLE